MRVGSLCSGYGGLDLAVEHVLGGCTVWHSEVAPPARLVLNTRWPGVPNLGDLTTVDWTAVAPVDVVTAGYPCQPFALAGRRKGASDDRHLWPHVRTAIRHLRPRLVLLENVAGHRSLGFDRVLGDLAEDGLDAEWTSLRASDVGAAHRRERLFILAYPRDAHGAGSERLNPVSQSPREPESASSTGGFAPHARGEARPFRPGLRACEPSGLWGPRSDDGADADRPFQWGEVAPAIRRWAEIVGRPAPNPVLVHRGLRANPRFIEWHMGLPDGWVTDVQGVSGTEAIEMLGNGVVPQQAAAAFDLLLQVSNPTNQMEAHCGA